MKQAWDHTYWGFFLAYFELKTLKKKWLLNSKVNVKRILFFKKIEIII